MAGEDAAAAANPAVARKLLKEEEEDDDVLDVVPLAICRAKKSGNPSVSKVKKEEEDDDDDEEDYQLISRSRQRRFVCLSPRSVFSGMWRGGHRGASDARS
jgi:hypothetical protein